MELKNNFAIKCDTLEQKKHIRQVLIDMGYEDNKKWNDENIENEDSMYWHIELDNEFSLYNHSLYTAEVITYHDFCDEHTIKPIDPTQPLDELIKDFQSEMNKRGFSVDICFRPNK